MSQSHCLIGVLAAIAAVGPLPSAGSSERDAALAVIAKIDGKVKFDPQHPKRVIAIDI